MSELDDLRIQNKTLKKLLANALDLLEKSKSALTRQARSQAAPPTEPGAKSKIAAKNTAKKKVISKKSRGIP